MEKQKLVIFLLFSLPIFLLHLTSYIFKNCVEFVGLVTANTLITHTYVWNLVSACFLELSLVKLSSNLFILWWILQNLPVPSLEQFVLYILFSILACTLGASICSFVEFGFFGVEEALTNPSYGFGGLIMSLLMMCRHFQKSSPIFSRFPKLTYQYGPSVYLLLNFMFSLISKTYSHDIIFVHSSFFFCWSYLRFYYRFDDGVGDKSEEFAFIYMFPQIFHLFLTPLSTAFYNICAVAGVYPPLEQTDRKISHHLRNLSSDVPVLEVEASSVAVKYDEVAERRRAKAMKMLDAKMAELSRKSEGWDDVSVLYLLMSFTSMIYNLLPC
eukprot:gene1154-1225_t